jgi:chitin synthase
MAKTLAVAPHFSLGGTGFMLMRYVYICLIVVVVMISMGNRPRG